MIKILSGILLALLFSTSAFAQGSGYSSGKFGLSGGNNTWPGGVATSHNGIPAVSLSITCAGTVTPASSYGFYTLTVTGTGCIIALPTSITAGDNASFLITEGTGSNVASFASGYNGWLGGTPFVATPSVTNYVTCQFTGGVPATICGPGGLQAGLVAIPQTIASVNLSNTTFANSSANATVGTVSATMSPTFPLFSGSFSVTGTNSGGFHLSGTTLQTNSGGTTSGTYSDLNIVATQAGISNSPQSISPTLVGSSSSNWTLVSHQKAQGAGGATATTAAINTTTATLLVVTLSYQAASGPTLSDIPLNSGWTQAGTTRTQGNVSTEIWYKYAPTTSATHTFSCNGGAGIFCTITASAWIHPVGSSAAVDQVNGALAHGTSLGTSSVTPAHNTELVIAALAGDSGVASAISITGSMTLGDNAGFLGGAAYAGAMAYWMQTTATTMSETWNWTGGVTDAASAVATFQ